MRRFSLAQQQKLLLFGKVDDRQIGEGKPGPITQKIQKLYFDVVKGKIEKYHYWLDFIT
ncbi:hypothetical protein BLFGPEAP_01555 [Candidatus Methanoperedenaceae archaeon GB50]|nr:hypothetical protein BLFGPEAP_01555 [Candidatus Methanoperedenaceae archaeon GB50]